MIMNLAVIALVALIAYMWTGQGLFSSFINFVCVLVAGAIALAVWEPLVYHLLLGVREDIAWALGLMAPFLVSLLLLRMAADRLISANLEFDAATNFVGGGAVGLASGVVAVGMLVLSVGFLRVGPGFLGYEPVRFDQSGSLVEGDSLWLPADKLTVRLYETLSVGGFAAGDTALALRHPDLHLQAGLFRHTSRGTSRTTLKPGDFQISGQYVVEGAGADELVTDSFFVDASGNPVRQSVQYLDGSRPPHNSVLRGFVVRFQAGGVESSGQFVIGASQVRLIVRTADGDAMGMHPIAVISQTSGAALTAGRWRFDAPEVFVASVGARRDTPMAFEFLVPGDAVPLDLLIKNVRTPVLQIPPMPGLPEQDLGVSQRDEAVRNLAILEGQPVEGAIPIQTQAPVGGDGVVRVSGDRNEARNAGVMLSASIPTGVMHRSRVGGLQVNDENEISRGRTSMSKADLGGGHNIPTALRVDRFAVGRDAVLVQVDVSMSVPLSPFGRALAAGQSVLPPLLVDTLGQTYQPIGFVHDDGQTVTIQYDPGQPITALSQIPQLSRSKPNDKLTLLFRVSRGVSIQQFTLGGQVQLAEFSPPLPTS